MLSVYLLFLGRGCQREREREREEIKVKKKNDSDFKYLHNFWRRGEVHSGKTNLQIELERNI